MRRTVRTLLIAAAITADRPVSAIGSASAAGLRVIGSSRSSGEFAVTAAAALKNHARVIYLRGYGHGLERDGHRRLLEGHRLNRLEVERPLAHALGPSLQARMPSVVTVRSRHR